MPNELYEEGPAIALDKCYRSLTLDLDHVQMADLIYVKRCRGGN